MNMCTKPHTHFCMNIHSDIPRHTYCCSDMYAYSSCTHACARIILHVHAHAHSYMLTCHTHSPRTLVHVNSWMHTTERQLVHDHSRAPTCTHPLLHACVHSDLQHRLANAYSCTHSCVCRLANALSCKHTCECTLVHTHTCMRDHAHLQENSCMCTHVWAAVNTLSFTHTDIHSHTSMQPCQCICKREHTETHIWMQLYTHARCMAYVHILWYICACMTQMYWCVWATVGKL